MSLIRQRINDSTGAQERFTGMNPINPLHQRLIGIGLTGEKWITLNNGDEFIRLTGIIRPQDISADNQIKSIKVANARIQYSGTGSFADTQKMGWLAQFFNGPLWPF